MTLTIYKVYIMVLGESLEREVEKKNLIPQNQTSFRRRMGTMDNVFALNYLVNRQLRRKGKMVAFFVDLKAAFDSVNREILGREIRRRGVREGLARRCEDIFKETKNLR